MGGRGGGAFNINTIFNLRAKTASSSKYYNKLINFNYERLYAEARAEDNDIYIIKSTCF